MLSVQRTISVQKYLMFVRATQYKRTEEYELDAAECFIALIICSTCFGHLHAHHLELEAIIVLLPHPGCIACCSAPNSRPPATKALHTICSNNASIVSSSWWWAYKCPKHVEQIINTILNSVESNWISSLLLLRITFVNHILVQSVGNKLVYESCLCRCNIWQHVWKNLPSSPGLQQFLETLPKSYQEDQGFNTASQSRISSACELLCGRRKHLAELIQQMLLLPAHNTCPQMWVRVRRKDGETHLTFKGLTTRCSDSVGACDSCVLSTSPVARRGNRNSRFSFVSKFWPRQTGPVYCTIVNHKPFYIYFSVSFFGQRERER